MRERNLLDELIQGVEEMRVQREAMFMKGRNAVEDLQIADMGTQELQAHALPGDKHLNCDLRKN
jgi:hypothetical protein